MTSTPREPIDVCAAVIRRGQCYLLATRAPHSHLSGRWEFPGGKIRPGETPEDCIRREIREELDLHVTATSRLGSLRHDYPERSVCLHFLACDPDATGTVTCREGQEAGWFTLQEMQRLDLAPADRRFAERLCRSVSTAARPGFADQ